MWWVLVAQTRVPCGGDGTFCVPDACRRLRSHLAHHLHGQATATDLLADAICDHVENPRPGKPLVASLHGSPGVGKSYFHQLLAQSLYNATDEEYRWPDAAGGGGGGDGWGGGIERGREVLDAGGGVGERGGWLSAATSYARGNLEGDFFGDGRVGTSGGGAFGESHGRQPRGRALKECPGRDCPGYKIIFGTDYVVREQEEQGRMLRDAIIDHLRVFPEVSEPQVTKEKDPRCIFAATHPTTKSSSSYKCLDEANQFIQNIFQSVET